jgi:hypothetical protein
VGVVMTKVNMSNISGFVTIRVAFLSFDFVMCPSIFQIFNSIFCLFLFLNSYDDGHQPYNFWVMLLYLDDSRSFPNFNIYAMKKTYSSYSLQNLVPLLVLCKILYCLYFWRWETLPEHKHKAWAWPLLENSGEGSVRLQY